MLAAVTASHGHAAGPLVAGGPEPVFTWHTDRCARWVIPDTPSRAWRDAEGKAHLVSGSQSSRALTGIDLDHVARDCHVLYSASGNPDPAAMDDLGWLHSFHTTDGEHVTALVHLEFYGRTGAGCRADAGSPCWRNSIVEVSSDDGGATFSRDADALVATLPYRYDSDDQAARAGYFNPSNIVERGGYLYVFLWAEEYRAQRRGACILRRPVSGGPADWRAWNGRDFAIRFADPYREDVADPAAHVCSPLPGVTSVISSVVESPGGSYLAVSPATRGDATGRVSGIYWMESDDLLIWTTPDLLLAVPLLWRHGCDEADVFAYPSLLDPSSPGRNYASIGPRPYLYLVEIPLVNCRAGPERNLVRFPLSLPEP